MSSSPQQQQASAPVSDGQTHPAFGEPHALPSPQDSLASSIHWRRKQGSSSDSELATWITIGAWLLEIEPAWALSGCDAAQHPNRVFTCSADAPLSRLYGADSAVGETIWRILREHAVRPVSQALVQRFVSRTETKHAVTITASGPSDNFQKAADAIRAYIHQCSSDTQDTFFVEIYNPRELSDPIICPVRCDPKDGPLLVHLRDEAYKLAHLRLGSRNVGVGLYAMRPPHTGTRLAAVITVAVWVLAGYRSNFDSLQNELLQMVQLETQGRGIVVQARLLETESLRLTACCGPVSLNASLGDGITPVGSEEAGSLGGYVNFTPANGATVKAFMTGSHVVLPIGEGRKRVEEAGVRLGNTDTPTQVQYPAQRTVERRLERLRRYCAFWRQELAPKQKEFEEWGKPHAILTRYPPLIADAEAEIQQLEHRRDAAKVHPFGTVIAASPLDPERKGEHLDWALVSLNDQSSPAFGPNYAPQPLPPRSYLPRPYQPGSQPTSEFGPLIAESMVVMRGLTSGIISGEVNVYETKLDLQEGYGIVGSGERPCLVWQVFTRANHNDMTRAQFSQPGDSGAWVFNEWGCVVGLCWGAGTLCGLLTPMESILDDITEWTNGGSIGLP